ncbi:MAG: hypothetical protein RIQ53_3089 [Pseudomonadota bacterium]|jgi:hypothetical protein
MYRISVGSLSWVTVERVDVGVRLGLAGLLAAAHRLEPITMDAGQALRVVDELRRMVSGAWQTLADGRVRAYDLGVAWVSVGRVDTSMGQAPGVIVAGTRGGGLGVDKRDMDERAEQVEAIATAVELCARPMPVRAAA